MTAFRTGVAALVLVSLLVGGNFATAADKPADKAAAHDAAHADHGAHAADPFATDPLSFKADLALWTLVVFIVLLIVLKKFAWGPIIAGLDAREQRVANHISQAEEASAEAKKLLVDYESKLATAQDEVRSILDEAKRNAELVKEEIVEKAKSEAAAEAARAKRDIQSARDQAMQELLQTSANLAVDLASKIIKSKLSAAEHQQLISDTLAKFPRTTASQN